jgi:GT2 family glycosyltransferase
MEKHNLIRPPVYIIILNWNGLKDTLECLESVYALDYPNFKVVVVDNGSTHDLPDSIIRTYPQVVLIKNDENLGFTGGNNVGMRYAMEAGAEYLWLLNNDTIVERDCLSKIINLAESSDYIGMVSPIICYLDNPDMSQFAGSYFDWKSFSIVYTNDEAEVGSKSKNGKEVCLWGTALLIKRSVIETIGFLKEEYFAYWEDTEYSLRVLKHGFQNVVCRETKIYHRAKMIEREYWARGNYFFYYMSRNLMLMVMEYIKGRAARLNFKIRCHAALADRLRFIPPEYMDTWDASLLGLWHGSKGLSGAMKDEPRVPVIYREALIILSRCHPLFLAALLRFDFIEMYRRLYNSRHKLDRVKRCMIF